MKIIICDAEMDDAFEKAFKKLYSSPKSWFSTKEGAENWAGDVAFEFVLDVLEQLGIEVG